MLFGESSDFVIKSYHSVFTVSSDWIRLTIKWAIEPKRSGQRICKWKRERERVFIIWDINTQSVVEVGDS